MDQRDQSDGKSTESDFMILTIASIASYQHRLTKAKSSEFAHACVESALRAGLEVSVIRETLEIAARIAEAKTMNGELEELPAAVELVYGLTRDQTKDLRINFLQQITAMTTMTEIRERAAGFYRPTAEELHGYVSTLPKEARFLIIYNDRMGWQEMLQTKPYANHRADILHFQRLEAQFGIRLREILCPPASQEAL